MNFVLFYHSLLSDWNHGNAHFLRGVATELLARGHQVHIYEPRGSWSAQNLLCDHGREPFRKFHAVYPRLRATRYQLKRLDWDNALGQADVVIVHEWNDPDLVAGVGRQRQRGGQYQLFFHDTHHRMVTDPKRMAAYELANYDGVLAYGRMLQELYERRGTVRRAWTWHEAADTRLFRPHPSPENHRDLVWIGNWGDGERTAELEEFLIQPSKTLGLRTQVYGVRYPQTAKQALADAGINYAGWLPNFEAPRVFAEYRATIHVPRRPYVKTLPGIPTIRPFEALACGIPLVCAPWDDVEALFTPGKDYLVARNGVEMQRHLQALRREPELRAALAAHGLRTIRSRHTCGHRVDQLLGIIAGLHDRKSESAPQRLPVDFSSGATQPVSIPAVMVR